MSSVFFIYKSADHKRYVCGRHFNWLASGRTTSLKWKAQRERRVLTSSHIFNGEYTHEIFRHLVTQKVQIYA